MAESTISNENLLSPKETHKVDTDDIKINPKRSRDNMSEDESNDKCIKKPRQEINTEICHPNTDNNNENKSIIVMNDTDKIQSVKNNDILKKKSAVQDLNEDKQSVITFEKCENMEIDEDKNSTLDNSNNVTEEGKPESNNDSELSIKCVSDNNSLEREENEKKKKLKQNTNVVEDTIKDSEVETRVLESKLSENSEKNDAEKTENEENKLLKSLKSDDDDDDDDKDNDSNNYENAGGEKSMQKNKITSENLKKITKKIKGKKKEKSAQDDEKHNQNDSNIDDKPSSSEKCESSTDDDSNELKYEDSHQKKKPKIKLNASKKKAAIKSSEKRNNSHDVTVKEKINSSDDEMNITDNENEDASLKNKINKSDIDENKSTKTTSNSEESNDDDDINDKKNPKKGETNRKNSKFDDEIARMKKYIHAAGIKVKKYDDLWLNCKSNKQKIDRLKLLLEENGISGRPTLQKCEMAKAKREQDREIAELDPKNIISEARITRSMKNCSKKSSSTSSSSQLSSSPQQKIRKRIQIVDSDSE